MLKRPAMPYTHQMTILGAGANANKPILDADLLTAAVAFAEDSKAQRTRDAYALHWREFNAWCEGRQVCALPCEPQILAIYITHLAQIGRKPAGIDLALTAISQAHKTTGHPSPRGHAAVRYRLGGHSAQGGHGPDEEGRHHHRHVTEARQRHAAVQAYRCA